MGAFFICLTPWRQRQPIIFCCNSFLELTLLTSFSISHHLINILATFVAKLNGNLKP
ncbi:hypothetical protein STH12_01052 [Shewanella khirikhana]|uniref:Uncharacterized protein n=1 Tax=Shewanella khirikhana TaxID=1965282 RepID=A0ABM7D1A6_9GAMM|nr:hypothetical protein STH12_01052 [Shewanella khirikhana]